MPKISKRLIDQSPPGEKDYFLLCDELEGFGCCASGVLAEMALAMAFDMKI